MCISMLLFVYLWSANLYLHLLVQLMACMERAALPTAKICLLTKIFDSIYQWVLLLRC